MLKIPFKINNSSQYFIVVEFTHYQLSTITCIGKSNLRYGRYYESRVFYTELPIILMLMMLKSAIDALLQSGILDEVTPISVIASIDRNSFRSMKPSYIDISHASTQYYLSLALIKAAFQRWTWPRTVKQRFSIEIVTCSWTSDTRMTQNNEDLDLRIQNWFARDTTHGLVSITTGMSRTFQSHHLVTRPVLWFWLLQLWGIFQ